MTRSRGQEESSPIAYVDRNDYERYEVLKNQINRGKEGSNPLPHVFFFALLTVAFGLVGSDAWSSPQRSFRPKQPSVRIMRFRNEFPSFAMSSDSLEDQLSAISKPSSSSRPTASSLIDAASAATQDSCQLLGIKSIGVDYGLVRTGIAATVGYEPKPIAILSDLNSTQVCEQVIRYAHAEQASRIVVGLPLHKNGTIAAQTNLTLSFGQELARNVLERLGPNVPVLWWDERYTSKMAAARARSRDPYTSVYGQLDADAACLILENYYHDNGQDAETVELSGEVRDECIQRWKAARQSIDEALRESENKREATMLRRKEAIAQSRKEEEEMAVPSRKKKKKKKRR